MEHVVLNALKKRLRRLIFCASGDPLCIVSLRRSDPPLARHALVPLLFVAQAAQRRSRRPPDHTARRAVAITIHLLLITSQCGIKVSAGAWGAASASPEISASASVWE